MEHLLENGILLPAFVDRDLTVVGLGSMLVASYSILLPGDEPSHKLVRLRPHLQPVSTYAPPPGCDSARGGGAAACRSPLRRAER